MVADNLVLLVVLIQQVICLFGIILNCAIIWITIKNKNLQNSYGYLLAIYSFSEALTESASFVPTVLTLMDTKIPLPTCFYLIGIQTTGAVANAAISLLLISLDRLVAALFPMFYSFVLNYGGCGKYVFGLMFFSIANSITTTYFNWLHVQEYKNITVNCQLGEQFGQMPGVYRDLSEYNLIVAYLATIMVYIILGIYIKFAKSATPNSQNIQKIYKSLATIMCVIFFFYFCGFSAGAILVPHMTKDPQAAFLYFCVAGQFFIMPGVFNAPVLYFCSTEYRKAMNLEFPFIISFLKVGQNMFRKNNNVVHVQPPQPAAVALRTIT